MTALANATDPFFKPFLEQIQLGGEATRTTINAVRVKSSEEFEAAFTAMEKDRCRIGTPCKLGLEGIVSLGIAGLSL